MKRRLSKNLTSKWSLKKPLYLTPRDSRYNKYVNQLKTNGFCDCETWGLDSVISEFILPRLIRFKEIHNGYPLGESEEKWESILDKMIFAFDWSLNHEEKKYEKLTESQQKNNWNRYEEGMQLFTKWFQHLWW